MQTLPTVDACVERVLSRVGKRILLATPLGIGKPNHLLNALYRRAKADRSIELTIHTALTLQKPVASSELERRFLEPMVARVFGDYPDLEYELDRAAGRLPSNVRVIEFYFTAGKYLNNAPAQRDYISSNYTHVARDLLARGVNVVAQQVAAGIEAGRPRLSLSCNPDLSLDILHGLRAQARNGHEFVCVAQINDQLPFMYGDAEIDPDLFDYVVDDPTQSYTLFGPPKTSIAEAETVIGLYASTLIRDGGELQVGIGALADALIYALKLRHEDNAGYTRALGELGIAERHADLIAKLGDTRRFERGLFASTEMLVDGFMHLFDAGILKRKVYDDVALSRLLNAGRISEDITPELLDLLHANKAIHAVLTEGDLAYLQHFGILAASLRFQEDRLVLPDGRTIVPSLTDPQARAELDRHVGKSLTRGAVVHAGFFLGPPAFYRWLRELPESKRRLIDMRSVTRINQLYGHEEIDRLHRRDARFVNTSMKVTLLGATAADGLEDGRVVSGVGGQYNFVAMAHELPGGRSVIQVRSTRVEDGELQSSLMWSYGMTTSPRHLRDLVITEYGIADLRGKTDEECIRAMLNIADSRFQPELAAQAKRAQKLADDYVVPERFRNNLPDAYRQVVRTWRDRGLFPALPFGSDLTPEERTLGVALLELKSSLGDPDLRLLLRLGLAAAKSGNGAEFAPLLERMQLARPKSVMEHFYRLLLIGALAHTRR